MNFTWLKYIKYLILSRHRRGHGIHSPFVFNLVSDVFRNKTDARVVLNIEGIRKKNLSDNRIITVTDLGAGSYKMNNSRRKVSDIVKYSAVSEKYGSLLHQLARRFGQYGIIELGTSAGISTMYLASASDTALVSAIEGCKETAGIAKENFSLAGITNVNLLTGSFDEILPGLLHRDAPPGMVFIDGNHRKEPAIKYFNMIADVSDKNTVIILDDIHSCREMEEAWSFISDHHKVSVTIDIFRMGIVFFRKGLSRSHYIIRY